VEPQWRIELFEQLQVQLRSRHAWQAVPLHFRTHEAGLLLAYLALNPRLRSRHELGELFWPNSTNEQRSHNLRTALHSLRRQIEAATISSAPSVNDTPPIAPLFLTGRTTIGLNFAYVTTDVMEFEALLGDYQQLKGLEREPIDEAIRLYRAPLLGNYQEEWLQHERLRLEQLLVCATERRAGLCATGGKQPAPAVIGLPRIPGRSFGREAEVGELSELLRSGRSRCITLTGPGGVGKTSLVLRVAHSILPKFEGRIHYIPLQDVHQVERLLDEILDQVKASTSGETVFEAAAEKSDGLERLCRALAEVPTLLILDNLEQLLPHAAPVLSRLLDTSPTTSLLTTSRLRLAIEQEFEYPITPLPVPTPASWGPQEFETLLSCPSVQLFVNRVPSPARFAITAENAADVAAICVELDGMPLAIEMSAAHAGAISPDQILSRLHQGLDLFYSRIRNIPERQRTMRHALTWSYRLLTPEQQKLLACLCVFRGGWTKTALEAICVVLEIDTAQLGRLCDWALVVREETAGEVRYRLLSSIQAFAREMLPDEQWQQIRHAHAHYYLDLAENANAGLMGVERQEYLRRLKPDEFNFHAALEWATDHDPQLGIQLAGALWRLWEAQGRFHEGRRWLDTLIAKVESQDQNPATPEAPHTGDPHFMARALNGAGRLAWYCSDLPTAREFARRGLSIAQQSDDVFDRIQALHTESLVSVMQGDATAKQAVADAVALVRATGDELRIKDLLLAQGLILLQSNDAEAARISLAESLQLSRKLGDRRGIAFSLNNLGFVAGLRGNFVRARCFHRESLAMLEEMNESWTQLRAHLGLGYIEHAEGNTARGYHEYTQCLEIGERLGSQWELLQVLEAIAYLCIEEEIILGTNDATPIELQTTTTIEFLSARLRQAVSLLGTAAEWRRRLKHPRPPVLMARHAHFMSLIYGAARPEHIAVEMMVGGSMAFNSAIDLARGICANSVIAAVGR